VNFLKLRVSSERLSALLLRLPSVQPLSFTAGGFFLINQHKAEWDPAKIIICEGVSSATRTSCRVCDSTLSTVLQSGGATCNFIALFLKRGVFRHKLNVGIIAGKRRCATTLSDVPFRSYEEEFFKKPVTDFQRSDDFKNNALADAEIRKQLTKYYHARAARDVTGIAAF
jgi:hypothetical protein